MSHYLYRSACSCLMQCTETEQPIVVHLACKSYVWR